MNLSRTLTSISIGLGVLAPLTACGGQGQGQKLAAESSGDLQNPLAARSELAEPFVDGCGAPALSPQGAETLDRLPYLQSVGADSALVLYTLNEGQAGAEVSVWTPDGQAVSNAPAALDDKASTGRQRMARLEGLEPNQLYCYAVGDLIGPLGFRTAPLPGRGTPVRFVAFGDSGSGSDAQAAVRDQLTTVQYDLILHTGDVAYGGGSLEQYERTFFDVYAELLGNVPTFPAAGNHDYDTDDGGPYREVFALPENGGPEGLERWYSFDWGDVHFVALDTQLTGPAQASWLERDLSQTDQPWLVVSMHHPPYSSGSHGSSSSARDTFAPIFERHGVQLVLSGHDHHYERSKPQGGVTYVVTGGGGRGTRGVGTSSFTAFAEGVLHFVYVEVEGNALTLHAIDGVGREFDGVRLSPRS